MSTHCPCGHAYGDHRVSAFGQKSMVTCTVERDYCRGEADERCYCVREFALADIPTDVRPFNARCVHPRFADIETCVAGMAEGLLRWKCHNCLDSGPPEEDGWRCKQQLAQHLINSHGVKQW